MTDGSAHRSAGTGVRWLIHRVSEALGRARAPIIILAFASLCPLVAGGLLATTGNTFALNQRDGIVAAAQGSETLGAYKQNDRLKAALLDFRGNVEAALVTSVTGLAVVGPLPIAAYRGWVGGVVSVDGQHVSRLSQPGPAFYYVVTLALQLIPYILTGGAGMHLGIAAWRRRNDASVRSLAIAPHPGRGDSRRRLDLGARPADLLGRFPVRIRPIGGVDCP